MPRNPILPDSSTLRNHFVVDHMTYDQIARLYGVTVSAVYQRSREIPGLVAPRPDYSAGNPWHGQIAPEHKDDPHITAIRALARREAAERGDATPLPPVKARTLELWIQARDEESTVVTYDHRTGFELVTRMPEDGDGYVRWPEDEKPRPSPRVQFMEP